MLEIGIGFEVGISFGNHHELAKRLRELAFSSSLGGGSGCGLGCIAPFDDVLERFFFVASVAFDGLDEIGHQVLALLQLHVDVGEGLFAALAHADQAIVGPDQPQHQNGNNAENNK